MIINETHRLMKMDRLAVIRTNRGCVTPGLHGWRVFRHDWINMSTEEVAVFPHDAFCSEYQGDLIAAGKFLKESV